MKLHKPLQERHGSEKGNNAVGKHAKVLQDNRLSVIQKMQTEFFLENKVEPVVQKKSNNTGLPDHLKSGIENLSGHSMDDVKVHYNSAKPAQLNAHAYAQGTDIHVASGQEKHLAHEAWHVVQQKQGRVKPTMQMKGKVNVNDDNALEKEADVMGAKAMTGQLLSQQKEPAQKALQQTPLFQLKMTGQICMEPDQNLRNSSVDSLVVQLRKGKLRYNNHSGTFYVRSFVGGVGTNYNVLNNDPGNFEDGDKVNFDVNALGRAINLSRVERAYIVPGVQGTGTASVLLGVKRTHYNGAVHDPNAELFAGGMPTAFGGDIEDGETQQQAVERELNEEIGFDVAGNHPALTQVHQENTKTNMGGHVTERATFNSAPNVVPNNFVLGAPTTEMQRTFILQLDTITAALNNRNAMMLQICAAGGVNIADPAHLTIPQAQFLASASLTAMINTVRAHREERYRQGLARAQSGQAANNLSASFMAGFNEYGQGFARAQSGQAAAAATVAYMAGFNEYNAGLARAQSGQAAQQVHASYMAGFNEYTAGFTRAQSGQAAQQIHAAYMAGFNEYNAGLARAQSGLEAQQVHAAYMAAFNEYNAGLERAEGGQAAQNNHRAYMAGFNEYTLGRTHGLAGLAMPAMNTIAYTTGYTQE